MSPMACTPFLPIQGSGAAMGRKRSFSATPRTSAWVCESEKRIERKRPLGFFRPTSNNARQGRIVAKADIDRSCSFRPNVCRGGDKMSPFQAVPQTSWATSRISSSLRFWSSSLIGFPRATLANPH